MCIYVFFVVFFFFKQMTAYDRRISDWSSDVCSSDLAGGDRDPLLLGARRLRHPRAPAGHRARPLRRGFRRHHQPAPGRCLRPAAAPARRLLPGAAPLRPAAARPEISGALSAQGRRVRGLRQPPRGTRPRRLWGGERRALPARHLRRSRRSAQHLQSGGIGGEVQVSADGSIPLGATRQHSETELRIDLAAAFRLAVEFGWHESVGNHFSATVSSDGRRRSEEHTSELQSLMRISYAVFCLKKTNKTYT